MRISLGTDSILWSLQAECFTQRQTSGKVDLDLDVVDTLRDFIFHFMIKRNLENVEVFTYLCRPPLQGTDAALQASQVSLSQSTPELEQDNQFPDGFCKLWCAPASQVWVFPSVYFGPGVAHLVSEVWWLCAFRPLKPARSAAEENILLQFYYLHYCYAGPARLHPDIRFDYFLFNFINTLFEHLLPQWLMFIEILEISFLGAKYFCTYKISDLRINEGRH